MNLCNASTSRLLHPCCMAKLLLRIQQQTRSQRMKSQPCFIFWLSSTWIRTFKPFCRLSVCCFLMTWFVLPDADESLWEMHCSSLLSQLFIDCLSSNNCITSSGLNPRTSSTLCLWGIISRIFTSMAAVSCSHPGFPLSRQSLCIISLTKKQRYSHTNTAQQTSFNGTLRKDGLLLLTVSINHI